MDFLVFDIKVCHFVDFILLLKPTIVTKMKVTKIVQEKFIKVYWHGENGQKFDL